MVNAEAAALAQARTTLQMERRVIMETEIEAAEARIAGNPALALRLEREAAIRAQALAIQRTLNVTTEESIVLAERLVLAQEGMAAATFTGGVNMARMKQEGIVLAREAAAGNIRASTLSSLLGSMGTSITIASIAGYELYQIISHSADQQIRFAKEINQTTEELAKQIVEWTDLANKAQSFGDTVKLADKMKLELATLKANLAKFRAEDLDGWRSWADSVAKVLGSALNKYLDKFGTGSIAGGGSGPQPFAADAAQAKAIAAEEQLRQAVVARNALLDQSISKTEAWAKAEANLPQGIADWTAKLSEAEAKLTVLEAARHAKPGDDAALKAALDQRDVVETLREQLNQLGDESDKANRKTAGGHQQVTALLREESALLQGIRQQQQLISQDPFLSIAAKDELLRNLYLKEQIALHVQILAVQLKIKELDAIGNPKEQAQVEELKAKLQGLVFTYDSLGQKIQTLSFKGGLHADLVTWVNSFGDAAQQVSNVITTTLNAAIEQTTKLLTDAIFRTGDWRAAWLAVEEAAVGALIRMVVQYIVSQTVMWAVNQAFGKQAQNATNQSAIDAAAAWAPGATSASIATYGAAAYTGTAAYIAGLVASEAVAVGLAGGGSKGGFKKGDYTGDGPAGEYAGPAHKGEFYFTKDETSSIGLGRIRSFRDTAKRFASGGRVVTDTGEVLEDPFGGGSFVALLPQPRLRHNHGRWWLRSLRHLRFWDSQYQWGGSGPVPSPYGLNPYGVPYAGDVGPFGGGGGGGAGGTGGFGFSGFGATQGMGGGRIAQYITEHAYAGGGRRTKGPWSDHDNLIGMFMTDEAIVSRPNTKKMDSLLGGAGWELDPISRLSNLMVSVPRMRFADGGRARASSGSSSSRAAAIKAPVVQVFAFFDKEELIRAYTKSTAVEKHIVNTMDTHRPQRR